MTDILVFHLFYLSALKIWFLALNLVISSRDRERNDQKKKFQVVIKNHKLLDWHIPLQSIEEIEEELGSHRIHSSTVEEGEKPRRVPGADQK